MQFQLNISLDNAEARYEDGGLNEQALGSYLEQAARKVETDHKYGTIIDGNGNTIGEYAIWDEGA